MTGVPRVAWRTGTSASAQWSTSRRWSVLLVLLAALLIGARGFAVLQPQPQVPRPMLRPVVVVGAAGHSDLSATDRAVLSSRQADAQVGAVSTRAGDRGDCAADGWATLGAGRGAALAPLCHVTVQGGGVASWAQLLTAAAADRGDAHLGTLAASVPGCISAVGTGAALAAARPDGSLAQFLTLEAFLASGSRSSCPITLVDAGSDSDAVMTQLSVRRDVDIVLVGIGQRPGAEDSGLQVIYRLGAGPAGWLTSSSTRQVGVVTLADVTRTLIELEHPPSAPDAVAVAVDGAPLRVLPGKPSAAEERNRLSGAASRPGALTTAYFVLGAAVALLLVVAVAGTVSARRSAVRIAMATAAVLPAAMTLTGSVPWYLSSSPGLLLSMLALGLSVVLTGTAVAAARGFAVPVAAAGAAIAMVTLTIDAALGGPLQVGSMLNPQPLDGGRWYGFGNITFAAYASVTLVVVGYAASLLQQAGRHRTGLLVGGVIGAGAVLADGWPSMGADFGGVLALTPPLVWLLISLSGRRVNWRTVLLGAGAAAAAVTTIAGLDWLRGPGGRSHLGAFIQRVLDGDAGPLLLRKALMAAQTLTTPVGLTLAVLGVLVWVLIFSRLLPSQRQELQPLRPVAVAVLATAVLGTLLNDSGVSVWATATTAFLLTVLSERFENGAAGASPEAAARLPSKTKALESMGVGVPGPIVSVPERRPRRLNRRH
jgi:hypothetical protein